MQRPDSYSESPATEDTVVEVGAGIGFALITFIGIGLVILALAILL